MSVVMTRGTPQLTASAKASGVFIAWLCLVLLFEYARPASYFGNWLLPFNSILPLSLLVVTFLVKGLRPAGEIYSDPSSRWLTAFVALIALGIATSDVTMQSYAVFTIAIGYYFLFIMLARIVMTRAHVTAVILTLAVAHVFLIIENPAVVSNPSVRSYIVGATFLGDGNDFALSLCVLVPMVLAASLDTRSKLFRILMWATVTVLLLAVIGTSSRGGTIGIAASFLYLWWHSRRRALGLLAFIPVVIMLAVYAPTNYFQRMGSVANYQQDGSAQGRIMAWKAGMRMALDNPLTGVSPGLFPVAFGTKYMPKTAERLPWLTAHSMYFLILGELGFPGIIVLVGILVSNLRANARMRRRLLEHLARGPDPPADSSARYLLMLNAAAVGLMFSGAFLSAAYYPHLFVLTGVLVAHRAIVRQDFPFAADPPTTLPRGRRRLRVAQAAAATTTVSAPEEGRERGAVGLAIGRKRQGVQ
jgi:putative inorganic carbon (hco3(-)) transporter